MTLRKPVPLQEPHPSRPLMMGLLPLSSSGFLHLGTVYITYHIILCYGAAQSIVGCLTDAGSATPPFLVMNKCPWRTKSPLVETTSLASFFVLFCIVCSSGHIKVQVAP